MAQDLIHFYFSQGFHPHFAYMHIFHNNKSTSAQSENGFLFQRAQARGEWVLHATPTHPAAPEVNLCASVEKCALNARAQCTLHDSGDCGSDH